MDTYNQLVGKTEQEAKEYAARIGYVFSVISRDGKIESVNTRYRRDRLQVEIVDDRISKVEIG